MNKIQKEYEEPIVLIKKFGSNDIMLVSQAENTDPDDNDVDDPWD